jgi:hypothetical protein
MLYKLARARYSGYVIPPEVACFLSFYRIALQIHTGIKTL